MNKTTSIRRNNYNKGNYLPQLRRAPIVKVLYKQANIGFAAEAVFFFGGERGRFAQKRV